MIGKGVVRFHAVIWPTVLLAAGEPLPTRIFVHDYLTVDGRKISKSLGNAIDPAEIIRRYGTDALRWWFAAAVPRVGDADFTLERLVERANQDLANRFGNLVTRIAALVTLHRDGVVPDAALPPETTGVLEVARRLDDDIDEALARFDLSVATGAIRNLVDEVNRYLDRHRPWELGPGASRGKEDVAIRRHPRGGRPRDPHRRTGTRAIHP